MFKDVAAVRRPAVWIPTLLGVLIGVVSVYLARPAETDAQTSRPTPAGLPQQVDSLIAQVASLNTQVVSLNTEVAALSAELDNLQGSVDDILDGTAPVGAVDGEVKVGNSSEPATAANAGQLRFSWPYLEFSDGAAWQRSVGGVLPVASARPDAPAVGYLFLNTTTGHVEYWNGSSWVSLLTMISK